MLFPKICPKIFIFQIVKMKGVSEETKQVLAAVDTGLKKLHTLDDSITLYEVNLENRFMNNAWSFSMEW